MEAKVDIRKLQLLNDRINQTIDALNQVRLSVHGLSQTAGPQGQVPGVGYSPYAQFGQGIGQSAFGQTGIGQGFGQPGFGQGFGQQGLGQGWGQGLQGLGGWGGMSHTGGQGVPGWGGLGAMTGQPWGAGQSWGAGQPWGGVHQAISQNPFLAQVLGVNPYFQTGISHSSPDAQWMWQQQQMIDPYYGMRVSQTFPFAQLPLSPVG
jgi:hypothetical protein